jgi:hypothetical protein
VRRVCGIALVTGQQVRECQGFDIVDEGVERIGVVAAGIVGFRIPYAVVEDIR